VVLDEECEFELGTGTSVTIILEGRYQKGRQSVDEYISQTAMANPHSTIVYNAPDGNTYEYRRKSKEMPFVPVEIKPHPYGIELGILRRMLATTRTKNLKGFLMRDFTRVGSRSADQIFRLAKLESKRKPHSLDADESERLHKSMQMVKLIAPPTNCLSPLTNQLIENGLKKELNAEYFVAVTRPPSVYRGNPFQIEVGLAYGGDLNPNSVATFYRFANKVPLLYHQSSCAITKSVESVDWRRYGLQQSTGSIPVGPIVILVHFASVWVPFTSEGKQAIAMYPVIIKETKLALQDAGRQLAKFVRQKKRSRDRQLRRQLFERYIPEVAGALSTLTKKEKKSIISGLEKIIKSGEISEGVKRKKR